MVSLNSGPINVIFSKMDQSRPVYICFRPFLIKFKYKLIKRRCCAWGSNPGSQDGQMEPLCYGGYVKNLPGLNGVFSHVDRSINAVKLDVEAARVADGHAV